MLTVLRDPAACRGALHGMGAGCRFQELSAVPFTISVVDDLAPLAWLVVGVAFAHLPEAEGEEGGESDPGDVATAVPPAPGLSAGGGDAAGGVAAPATAPEVAAVAAAAVAAAAATAAGLAVTVTARAAATAVRASAKAREEAMSAAATLLAVGVLFRARLALWRLGRPSAVSAERMARARLEQLATIVERERLPRMARSGAAPPARAVPAGPGGAPEVLTRGGSDVQPAARSEVAVGVKLAEAGQLPPMLPRTASGADGFEAFVQSIREGATAGAESLGRRPAGGVSWGRADWREVCAGLATRAWARVLRHDPEVAGAAAVFGDARVATLQLSRVASEAGDVSCPADEAGDGDEDGDGAASSGADGGSSDRRGGVATAAGATSGSPAHEQPAAAVAAAPVGALGGRRPLGGGADCLRHDDEAWQVYRTNGHWCGEAAGTGGSSQGAAGDGDGGGGACESKQAATVPGDAGVYEWGQYVRDRHGDASQNGAIGLSGSFVQLWSAMGGNRQRGTNCACG